MTSKCMTCFKSKNERKKMDLLPKDPIIPGDIINEVSKVDS